MPRSAASIRAIRQAKRSAAFSAELSGAREVRGLFNNLPEAARAEIASVLDRGGLLIAAEMQRRAPKKTQALAAGLVHRVLRRTLRLRVGLLGTPTGRAKLFYGRIQDLGRTAQTVVVKRYLAGMRRMDNAFTGRNAKSAALTITYKLRVRSMAPKRFITGQFPRLRNYLRGELKNAWAKIIGASRG